MTEVACRAQLCPVRQRLRALAYAELTAVQRGD